MRLTSLTDAFAALDAIESVAPRRITVADSLGCVLAADVMAPQLLPVRAQALYDGFAVQAEATLDASAYAPVVLAKPFHVDSGSPLPDGTDAVATFDAVEIRGETVAVTVPVASGESVIERGGDCAAGTVLRRAGCRVRASDAAVFALAGVKDLNVRSPTISIGCARKSAILGAAAEMIANELLGQGARASVTLLDAALADNKADAVIGIGGTGSGTNDKSVQMLSRIGRVVFHGVGLMPGETAAFGFAGERPVLLVPGRLDAALAAWCVLGQRLFKKLCGGLEDKISASATLTRKVASSPGVAEFIPVHVEGGKAEPLAAKYLPLSTLAIANGWILVPPESEGYQAGTSVRIESWR